MKRTKSIYLALLAVLLSPMAANADPITGTYDLTLAGTTSGSGSFAFDAVTGLVSDFSMTFGTFTVTDSDFGSVYANDAAISTCWIEWAITAAGTRCIATPGLYSFGATFGGSDIYYVWDLTNAFQFRDINVDDSTVRGVFSATLRGTSVPEPSTLALLGLGLVGMAARRRKTV